MLQEEMPAGALEQTLSEAKLTVSEQILTDQEKVSESPEKTELRPTRKQAIKPRAEAPNPREIADIEVAKKMLKINQSAVDRNLEFNLSFETVKKLMTYKRCYYTDREFENKENGLYARSFDRIESNKGYIEGNVVACTVDINGKKSNLSFEEIKLLYHKLVAFMKK